MCIKYKSNADVQPLGAVLSQAGLSLGAVKYAKGVTGPLSR